MTKDLVPRNQTIRALTSRPGLCPDCNGTGATPPKGTAP